MPRSDLDDLIDRLRSRGLQSDADALDELGRAVDSLRRPPGILTRWTVAARERVAEQWRLAMDEWGESRAAFRIVREKVAHGRELDAAEAEALRSQVVDLVKTLPAGVVAAATAVTPVPGAMLLTPWVLSQLHLLPSRWREDAVLRRLRGESARLRDDGETRGAAAIEEVAAELEDACRAQDEAAQRSDMLTHWDLNGDGVVDASEETAYRSEVARLAGTAVGAGAARRWYVMFGCEVVGPVSRDELLAADPTVPLLVCLDGESGWVRLADFAAAARNDA